jgi:pyridoxal phosphate enzyme (YggS family)
VSPSPLHEVLQEINNAVQGADRPLPRLLAVSKAQTPEAIRALAAQGQRAFGENYVQEALRKQAALADLALEWHLIGHLQSNKAADVARAFDWVQSVDRLKLVDTLGRHRPAALAPLQVLIQVNIDDEASKHGCAPGDIDALAQAIAVQPRLCLRGLMAIPAPAPDLERRREAFSAMKALYDALAAQYASVDTLSMGMSADYALAVAEGASMVRVGTALFGSRPTLAPAPPKA